ncbi:MAG: hypothetical protein M1343_08230 [Chloroflexi bacterium]|nr:hypothetical protein [Chloroflexota bacterium]
MLNVLAAEYKRQNWSGPIYAIHAHLGRAEWPQTLGHCEKITRDLGIELVVVSRPQGDLVQEIHDRMEKVAGTYKPHWPSATNRYCTSDQKRGQIDKVIRVPHWPSSTSRYCTSHHKSNQIDKAIRSHWPSSTQRYCTADQKRDQIVKQHRQHRLVVAAMGLRAEESPARAKKQAASVCSRTTSTVLKGLLPGEALAKQQSNQHLTIDWLAIHDWKVDDVWDACGTDRDALEIRRGLYREGLKLRSLDGWPAHPAYVFGNERLSCAICILASKNDIINGAKHNPELYREYVAMERESGFTFRHGFALESLGSELELAEVLS